MASRTSPWTRLSAAVLVPAGLAAALCGAAPVTAQVAFAPPADAKFDHYGKNEEVVLQGRILEAVSKACQVSLPAGITIHVVVEDVAPSYPTKEQLSGSPALDPTRTHLLGGAQLTGYLVGDRGEVLSTVKHRYFPPTIQWRSYVYDPWSDADKAFAQFADQLGGACKGVRS
jgi:hypothetical protein